MLSTFFSKSPINLQPEQKKVLQLPAMGAILVKGVAGSGKTTIALHRAKYLVDTHRNLFAYNTVIVFTYNRLLSNYLRSIQDTVTTDYSSCERKASSALATYVTNFHKWAYHFMLSYGDVRCKNILSPFQKKEILLSLLAAHPAWGIAQKYIEFLSDEISWIKGKLLLSLDEYQNIARSGRGTSERLSQLQRNEVWCLLTEYNSILAKTKRIDYDDYASVCLDLIDNDRNFSPLYSHIVIDEAQDLTKAQLLVMQRLVQPETKSITVIADSAQRIYKSGFTWAEVGLAFKGKTCVLKRNYRSTIEISRAALSLLNHDPQNAEFTQIESARKGSKLPVIYHAQSAVAQWKYLTFLLADLTKKYKSIVILQKTKADLEASLALLQKLKYSAYILSKSRDIPHEEKDVYLSTYQSIKGLEFNVVIMLDCNADAFSYNTMQKHDDLENLSTERRILFTIMTRAREELYIFSSKLEYSPLLDEIDSEFIEKA